MFAVIKTGGKQYKVAKNDVLKIEKIEGSEGATVVFDEILAIGDDKGQITLGTPLVSDIKVSAEILAQKKDSKVLIFKKKRRQNYRRKKGHRQHVTLVRIQDIGKGLQAKAAPAKKVEMKKAESKAQAAPEKQETTAAAEEKKPAAKKTAPKAKKEE